MTEKNVNIFIDTHAHLYAEEFADDRQAMIHRAKQTGIAKVVLPAIDSTSHKAMLELAQSDPDFFIPFMGLHPTSVKENYKEELALVEKYLQMESVFKGIGEIGIDLYWDKTYFKEQREAFQVQVQWARERQWPIIIHTRDSFTETYEALQPLQDGSLSGIFHCFGGSLAEAQQIIDLGFKLGLGGVLTFKNTDLRDIIKHVDLNHLVLETDSPYLAPVPHRGKRNESSYMIRVAEVLAEVHQTDLATIAEATSRNAINLLQIG